MASEDDALDPNGAALPATVELTLDAEALRSFLALCAPLRRRTWGNPSLHRVLFERDATALHLVATDGHRLLALRCGEGGPALRESFANEDLDALASALAEATELTLTGPCAPRRLCLKGASATAEEAPPFAAVWRSLAYASSAGTCRLAGETLERAVRAFTRGAKECVTLETTRGGLTLRDGERRHELAAATDGTLPPAVLLDARYLRDLAYALRAEPEVELGFRGALDPLVARGGRLALALMPRRA